MKYETVSQLENAPDMPITAPSRRTIRTTATLCIFCLYNQDGRRGAQFARIARGCFQRLERYGVRSQYDITRHEIPGLYNTLKTRYRKDITIQ